MEEGVTLWGSHRVLVPTTHYRDPYTGEMKQIVDPFTGGQGHVIESRMEDSDRAAGWAFLASSGAKPPWEISFVHRLALGDTVEVFAHPVHPWHLTFTKYLCDLSTEALDWLVALLRAGNLVAEERDSGLYGVPYFATSEDARARLAEILKSEIVVVSSGSEIARIYSERKARARRLS